MKTLFFTILTVCIIFCSTGLSAKNSSQMALSGQLGLQIPTGDFGDIASTGFSFQGIFSYYFNKDVALNFTLGYYGWGTKSSGDYYETTFHDIPLLAGITYKFDLKDFDIFIGGDIGLHFSGTKTTLGYGGGSVTNSNTDFGFSPLAGVLIPIAKDLDIRADLKYNFIFGDKTNTFFGINAGITYFFK